MYAYQEFNAETSEPAMVEVVASKDYEQPDPSYHRSDLQQSRCGFCSRRTVSSADPFGRQIGIVEFNPRNADFTTRSPAEPSR